MAVFNRSARGYSLPEFTVPAGKELWELGAKKNWDALDALLQPFDFGKFWVLDEATEKHLAAIRGKFDDSCGICGSERILNQMLENGDDVPLFQKVLSLGVNPDLPDAHSWRPSHESACYHRPKFAKAVSLCRPSLSAKVGKKTASDVARDKGNAEVIAVWENVEKEGFPSVAKLAYLKEWAALQNLCRRRVISSVEAEEQFDGKNAVGWARYHGEKDLAKELRYLLKQPPSVRPLNEKAKSFFSDIQDRVDALNEQLVLAVETMSRANAEVADLKRDILLLKGEVGTLKTALAEKDREIGELKKSMAAFEERTDDLADGVEDLNGVFEFLKTSSE